MLETSHREFGMVVCCVAQEAGTPHCEYIEENHDAIFMHSNSVLPLQNKMIFVLEMSATISSPDT